MPEAVALIVPCYDEEARLDGAELLRLARARPDLSLLLVDDGSRDRTPELLEALRRGGEGRVAVLRLARNAGKAEAVRQGLLAALAGGARVVGFADADLSTPVDELVRLVDDMRARPVEALLGSRVKLLGTRIEREAHRHYLGRVFATVASLALRLPVYDTQCGAKLFRASPALEVALARPFRSRWIFDVELLSRLLEGAPGVAPVPREALRELPLQAWRDVGGSKLKLRAMLRAGLQLLGLLLRSRLGARRRGGAGPAPVPGPSGRGRGAAP